MLSVDGMMNIGYAYDKRLLDILFDLMIIDL